VTTVIPLPGLEPVPAEGDVGDQEARDTIASRLDRTLVVEAGAGTGKTRALVDRVATTITEGLPVTRLAAITFTDAAAAELRDRIRARLEEAVRADSDAHHRERALAALDALDDATIGTLHAFAQRILAEHPLEAGLPPGFEVMDDIEASIAFRERWTRFLDELFAEPSLERALLVTLALGMRLRALADAARALHDRWDLLVGASPTGRVIPRLDVGAVREPLEAALARARECDDGDDALLAHLLELEALADALRTDADELDTLALLGEHAKLSAGNKGRKVNWPDGVKGEVVALLLRAEEERVAAVDALRLPALHQLADALVRFTLRSVEERRAEGRLEFHDLLVLARNVVRDDVHVRAVLHDKYRALLLDELQDTDPIQIELAVLIVTDDADVGTRHWSTHSLPPGSLFLVGDPKQSIYRFRRADVSLYLQVRDALGERLRLTHNFRSRPGILEWVNAVFGALMGDDDALPPDGPARVRYTPLAATCEACVDTPAPVRVVGDAAPRGTPLGELRAAEADEIAATVARIRAEGWPVREPRLVPGAPPTRPARYADIAILLPSRATLPYLEQALEDADIPARIESQSLVFATTEVNELLAVLAAVDDPTDEISIVASLRSPGFGCRDDELLEFAHTGGRWDYRREPPAALGADHRVVAALAALRALHERRWWESVSATVDRIVRERRLLELAVAHRRPRDHWRRIRFVADTARAFVERGGTSLREFVDWVRSQIEEEARAVEVVVPEPDDDAVRILTMHGAKGLEFPVVVLAGLGVRDRHQPGPVLWGSSGPELRVGRDFPTEGYHACRELDQQADEQERLRLLYVAATRARDHLVVSLHHRVGDPCDAARVLPLLGRAPATWRRVPAPVDRGRAVVAPPGVAEAGEPHDAWLARREALIEHGRRDPAVAATALAHGHAHGSTVEPDGSAAPPEHDRADGPDAAPWKRGRAGTAVGRAVHAVLQSIDLRDGAGLEATARAQALAEGVPGREREIAALARSVLASPVVRAAATSARSWREVPVGCTIDGVVLEGFVDLLWESTDGLVVVDYKTDAIADDASLDRAMERYAIQGAAYVLALESVLDRPVQRVVFVFAAGRGAREVELVDLRDAVARARALVAESTTARSG
jgi:ATP-dependent helicase/nuclease subunit A